MRLTPMLFVKDLGAMARFYVSAFGLERDEAASSPGYDVLVGGDVRLALHQVPPQVAELLEITDPPEVRSDYPTKLCFDVADVPATKARLEALGAPLVPTWSEADWDVVDPEGNVLHLGPARPSS